MSAIIDRTPLGASRDTSRALLGPVMGFVASREDVPGASGG